ncbi:MAG TPA: hypothetical protein VF796_18495, partial [Humisphaera sp.]
VPRRLADAGLPPGRVEVLPPLSRPEFLRRLGAGDVLLDTFPYNGMTTTCDALFLGVPTVSLTGRSHVSRVGASLLGAAGLGDLVAPDDDGYVAAAAGLAADVPRLRAVQARLAESVARSPLGQGGELARKLEAVYAAMAAAGGRR